MQIYAKNVIATVANGIRELKANLGNLLSSTTLIYVLYICMHTH